MTSIYNEYGVVYKFTEELDGTVQMGIEVFTKQFHTLPLDTQRQLFLEYLNRLNLRFAEHQLIRVVALTKEKRENANNI